MADAPLHRTPLARARFRAALWLVDHVLTPLIPTGPIGPTWATRMRLVAWIGNAFVWRILPKGNPDA